MNAKYDKLQKNMPVKYPEINRLWIYEGSNEMDYTPFAGKYFNRAAKAILVDFIYLQKVAQINKGILSALEGNYVEYDTQTKYSEGDVVYNDGYFYISLSDQNTKALENTDFWYRFRMSLNEYFMTDTSTGKLNKITLEDGELKIKEV